MSNELFRELMFMQWSGSREAWYVPTTLYHQLPCIQCGQTLSLMESQWVIKCWSHEHGISCISSWDLSMRLSIYIYALMHAYVSYDVYLDIYRYNQQMGRRGDSCNIWLALISAVTSNWLTVWLMKHSCPDSANCLRRCKGGADVMTASMRQN